MSFCFNTNFKNTPVMARYVPWNDPTAFFFIVLARGKKQLKTL